MRRACARARARVASTAAIQAAGKRVASVIHRRRLSTASSLPSKLIGDGASEQSAGVRKPRAPLRPHGAIKSSRNRLDLSVSQVPAPRLAQFGSGG